jgi:hypothetical protein
LGGSSGGGHNEIIENNEEAALGPASSCRALQEAKGTDLRRLWIPEDVGCHLQECVLQCKSGMVHERCQKWLYQGQGWAWNPESMDA